MTTNSEDCKKIEQLLKSLLFNKDASLESPPPIIHDTLPHIKSPPLTCPFEKTHLTQADDLLFKSYSNQSSSQSTLIDNEALLRFATSNIKEKNIQFSSEAFHEPPFSIAEKCLGEPPPFPNNANYTQELIAKNLLSNPDDGILASNSLTSSPSSNKAIQQRRSRKKKSKKDSERKSRNKLLYRDLIDNSGKHDKILRNTPAVMKFPSLDSLAEEGSDEFDLVSESDRLYAVSFDEENTWELTCHICDFSTTNDRCFFPHLKSSMHKRDLKKLETDFAMKRLPEPLPAQEEAITELLLKLHKDFGLSEKHLEQRNIVASEINKLISDNLPDCSVVLTGSSVSGCGLQNSEMDIILKVGLNLAAERLTSCYELLLKSDMVKNVISGFEDKIPKVKFKNVKFGLFCNLIIVDPRRSLPVTSLLALYCSLESRVPPLTTAFKYFAQLCELDQPELGTLPSFSFSLMLIHFLQQQQPPVLPVVQEDPSCSKEIDCEAFKANCKWSSRNTDSLGLLWIKLLKFYCLEYEPGQDVVSMRSSKRVKCKDKGWGTKFLAIEDPVEVSRNLAHVVPNKCVFGYIMGCFKNVYSHFGYPRLASGPLKPQITTQVVSSSNTPQFTNERSMDESLDATDSKNDDILNDDDHDILEDHDADLPFDDVISTISKMTMDDIKLNEDDELDAGVESSMFKSPLLFGDESPLLDPEMAKKYNSCGKICMTNIITKSRWDTSHADITKDSMKYIFQQRIFVKGQELPLVCRLCSQLGHLKKDCPEERLPMIVDLPPMTSDFLLCLDKVCSMIRMDKQPVVSTLTHNENDRASLQLWIQDIYPDAELELFGSFCNGFGFDNSDLDFCLTFKDNESGEGLKYVEIIEALAAKLLTIPSLTHVVPITSAKVPIVKFSTRRGQSSRECDISLYNTLAQHNTKMLQMYCSIDERVQGIGFAIKHWAKVLDICDASKGSLSSYAYVLMAIFYLQQRKPPIIPVLQELYKGEKPLLMVDNWNAWFFDDLEKLASAWPEYGKNKESIGELWLGLLSFYSSEFDFSKYVISIKQKALLTRFSKLWQSRKIAIEDPFDLNHNLGAGLSRKMSNYIRKCFIYAREHFGSPFRAEKFKKVSGDQLMLYFFDEDILNRGCKPPKDRVCRNCGKIGHVFKNCAVKRNATSRKDDRRNQNADMRGKNFEKVESTRQPIGANRNKKPVQRKQQHERQLPSNSELPYANSDMPFMNRAHDSLIRHPLNMASQFQQQHAPPPPGFASHFSNNGLMPRNSSFPLRPATSSPFPPTSSPFPPTSSNTINNSSAGLPPNVNMLQSSISNSKPWPTNQRLENIPRFPYETQRWRYRPIARLNHALDQSNLGVPLHLRNQSMQQFPSPLRHAAVDQERSRTNPDLGRLPHAKW